MTTKTIAVSSLDEAAAQIAAAIAEGHEFLHVVGAATAGGAMLEGEHGDIFIDLLSAAQNALGTRRGGSDDDCMTKLRAAR